MLFSKGHNLILSLRKVIAQATTLLLFPGTLYAAESGRPVADAISATQIVNLLGGLIFVLIAFFVVVFLLKRLSGLNGMNKGHMKIIDAMHLGPKERLVIVKVSNKHLLLGVSAQGIHPLHVIDEEIVELDKHHEDEAQGGFNQLLAKINYKGA